MPDINTLTAFFGWCSLVNIAILLFSTFTVIALRTPVAGLHGRLLGIDPAILPLEYFRYLGQYKLAIIVFNIVPYLALRIID